MQQGYSHRMAEQAKRQRHHPIVTNPIFFPTTLLVFLLQATQGVKLRLGSNSRLVLDGDGVINTVDCIIFITRIILPKQVRRAFPTHDHAMRYDIAAYAAPYLNI